MSESKALCLCAVVLCRTYKKSLVRRPLGALKLAGNVDDPPIWCGAAWTIFVRGTWRPPSLVEKLLSGTRDLSECYNNMDVGVPLWLTELRDKHPRQEFATLYPPL